MPSGQRSGSLFGAYTSSMSLVVAWASARSSASEKLDGVNGTPTGALRNQFEFGGRLETTAWCTCSRLDGRISDICTHLSSVNPVGAISYVYSTKPVAGRPTGCGSCATLSGSGMFQPLAQRLGGGASFGEPAGAPASTHAEITAICCDVSEGSLANFP